MLVTGIYSLVSCNFALTLSRYRWDGCLIIKMFLSWGRTVSGNNLVFSANLSLIVAYVLVCRVLTTYHIFLSYDACTWQDREVVTFSSSTSANLSLSLSKYWFNGTLTTYHLFLSYDGCIGKRGQW